MRAGGPSTLTVAEALKGQHDNFTLLRLALAVAVVVSHAFSVGAGNPAAEPLYSSTGYTLGEHGVNGFFAVSGFLVAMSWDRRGGVLPFAAARLLRVFPGFVVAVLATALAIGGAMTTLPFADYARDGRVWRMIVVTLTTFKSATTLPGVFESNALRWPISTVWTLRYELICYAALLAYGALGGFRKPWLLLVGAAAAALTLAALAASGPIAKGPETSLRLPLIFACGALAYLYRDTLPLSIGLVVAALATIALAGALAPALYRPALFVGSAYLILYVALAPALALPRLEPPGDISYGVYLYGWPIQQALQALAPGVPGWVMLAPALALTAGIATLSWIFVEKPALSIKNRLMPPR